MNSNTENSKTTAAKPAMTWPAPLLDIACAVASQKIIVFVIVVLGLVAGAARLALMPPVYTSSAVAVLLPREKPVLDAAIDTSSIETTDDSASRSSSGSLMLPPNPSLYTTLIYSRAVLSRIADRFEDRLQDHLSPRDRSDEVIQQVRSMLTVTSTEEGLITITVSCKDANLSADIANELFAECQKASKSIERQLILQQAGHLEDALQSSLGRLAQTEKELSGFTAQFGVVDVQMQASNQLRSIRELSAEKDRLETDLQELLLSYSERSPEVRGIRTRIAAIEKQMQGSRTSIVGSIGAEDFGSLMVAHESLKQKIRFERDLVATLATKADIYRLRAEEPTGNLAVIRPATAPTRPAGPSKKRELGLALGLSILAGLGWSVVVSQWNAAMADAFVSERIREFIRLAKPTLPVRKAARVKQA
jgi:uncharacterized protein involved in exopolysaccharide biosynthesis